MKTIAITAALAACASHLFLSPVAVQAEPPQTKAAKAPPLGECKVSEARDLGLWDDVFVDHDLDFVVLRRGAELFSRSLEAGAAPRKLTKVAAADKTQIVAGAAAGKKLWLFLNSSTATPCTVEAFSGKVVQFEVPGLKVPGSQTPGIQSSVIVPHAGGALLSVSGGDRATWPRDGNRPVYFWMSLDSGKVVQAPIGWDLYYFSADQRIAVFSTQGRAIDMKTGERAAVIPDLRKDIHVPYDWTDKQRVKPIYGRREGKGDADFFAGLSVSGRVLPVHLDLGLEQVYYMSMAKADEAFAGFRLRRSGQSVRELSPLWLVPFKEPHRFEPIATGVLNFALLGSGNAIYVTGEHGAGKDSSEAFFYDHGSKAAWNILDGVERLPQLDKKFATLSYIVDKMVVTLVEGFGTRKSGPIALCLCSHYRGDMRAFRQRDEAKKALKRVDWRRTIIVTHDGRRCQAPLLREGRMPDQIWLHTSGTLLTGEYVWLEANAGRRRQVQLREQTIQLPKK